MRGTKSSKILIQVKKKKIKKLRYKLNMVATRLSKQLYWFLEEFWNAKSTINEKKS
jgi:hypothetical protein